MSVRTDESGRIRKADNGTAPVQRRSLAMMIESPDFMKALRSALPKHITADKMARIALTALRTTRDLAACTPESFFACLLQAAQLGLEVNTPNGHAYLIPRRNNHASTMDCTLIIGYQGMIELALRSGNAARQTGVSKIWTRAVREGDQFTVKLGLVEDIVHIPSTDADREDRPITYVYAVAKLHNGDAVFEVLSKAQIDKRRKMGAAGGQIWAQHEEAMTRKTAVRSLFKWVPKSSEMALAEALEQRADDGRPQLFDADVHDAIGQLGMQPLSDDEPETPHDRETGEVAAAQPPESGN